MNCPYCSLNTNNEHSEKCPLASSNCNDKIMGQPCQSFWNLEKNIEYDIPFNNEIKQVKTGTMIKYL